MRLWLARHSYERLRDKIAMKIAWWLPRRIVMWAAVRMFANATTGPYSNQVVPSLLAMDALQRWVVSGKPQGPIYVSLWLGKASQAPE